MKQKVYVRMIPVVVEEDADSFKISIPGTNQTQILNKEDFDKRFGNCVDADTLLSTLKHVYNGTHIHCEELKEKYQVINSIPYVEKQQIEKEWKQLPVVEEKLRRMKYQIDTLENIKNEMKNGNTNQEQQQ